MSSGAPNFTKISLQRWEAGIFVLSLRNFPENRLSSLTCKEIIQALHFVQKEIGPNSAGALIITSDSEKFYSNGVDLEESIQHPWASTDGFYPMLAALLDFPYPTIACITGHCYGGATLFALAQDYRVMNSQKGFFCMPALDLAVHFNGIGSLIRLKLRPQIARQMLLETHRWTGQDAYRDGILDVIAPPDQVFEKALVLARKWAPKAEKNVYGVLRDELWGEAATIMRRMSYIRSRDTAEKPAVKL